MTWRGGGCHCGAVRFEALLPDVVPAQTCTCTICKMTGFTHVITPESRFRLTSGADKITTYTFNTGVAKHTFCSVCGIKAFYRPRSNPDGWSVNARCLDASTAPEFDLEVFDGANWEQHGHTLAHLSHDEVRA